VCPAWRKVGSGTQDGGESDDPAIRECDRPGGDPPAYLRQEIDPVLAADGIK